VGICEGEGQEDVEMDGGVVNGGIHQAKRRFVVGSAELSFKRDAMEIQPLFSEAGISKIQRR
jgi:hypothetical protein